MRGEWRARKVFAEGIPVLSVERLRSSTPTRHNTFAPHPNPLPEYRERGQDCGHKSRGGLGYLGRNKAALLRGQAMAGCGVVAQLDQKNGTIKNGSIGSTYAESWFGRRGGLLYLRPPMPLSHVTKGRVVASNGSTVVFKPANTTYELHLTNVNGAYDGPIDVPVKAVIRATARKVYTVPSGGLFVTPIMGPTRIVQGRVADLSASELTVSAVAAVNVTLPSTPGGIELAEGAIQSGSLVNVVLMPGATFERVLA